MLARLRQVATNKYYFDVRKYLYKKIKVVTATRPQIIFVLLPGDRLQSVANRIATP